MLNEVYMGNFSDYVKNTNNENSNKTNMGNASSKKLDKEDMENLIDKYSSYDSDTLLKEFMKMTIDKKRRGELSDNELENIKNTMLPYLNANQKNSLEKMMDIIKNV